MMTFMLKITGLHRNALKLFPSFSSGNAIRKISFRKFNLKDNMREKFRRLASAFGYSVGITMVVGISNFPLLQTDISHIIPTMCCNYSYCEASDHRKQPQSLRKTFNFLADVVEKTQNSVVYIEINARHPYTGRPIPISSGSGFIVKEDGLILTNAHVVNHFGQVIVKLYDGTTFLGVVENIDTENDLATVRIKAKNLPALPLGNSSDIRPGEFVIAMGNPLTLSHTITAGVVSSTHRNMKDLGLHKISDYIQTDATIHIGNSGGPLVNLDGEVIGINTMKVTEGISFAIPSDYAVEFLKKSEKSKPGGWSFFRKSTDSEIHEKQKYLGLSLFTLKSSMIKDLKERDASFPLDDHGVLVCSVMIDSPAYGAGIRPGDIISKVNKKEVTSVNMVMEMVKKYDVLELTVHRGQKTFIATVSLVEPAIS